jgi:DNA processing protein
LNEVEYWIWLQQAFGPGSPRPGQLLETFGGAEDLYKAPRSELMKLPGLATREIDSLCDKSLEKVESITEACLRLGCRIIPFDDAGFPQRLRTIYAPPCVLYVLGELADVDDTVLIAIVGTRQITEYGMEAATKLAIGLASHGAVVVSGLALGVDTAAHRGALKGGGKTIAVIGCGLDINYPASNNELRRLIIAHGAIVSEYPPGTQPMSFTFPVRNRIIAGLSLGTVVVEAGSRSGALITAGLAVEMGRDVYAVPGSIFSPMSEGTNKLLRDGAKPVLGVADILEEYIGGYPQSINIDLSEETAEAEKPAEPVQTVMGQASIKPAAKKAAKNLTKTQAAVYEILSRSPVHVDEISLRANLEPRMVLAVLTTLEIEGLALSHPGRRFSAV